MLERAAAAYVATTGPRPGADEAYEAAAIRFDGGREGERWAGLIRIRGALPLFVREATGLKESDFRSAAGAAKAGKAIEEVVGDRVVVCWDEEGQAEFLRALAPACAWNLLDARRLAMILLPDAATFDLDRVAGRLGLSPAARGRAEPTAELLVQTWRRLNEEALKLPLAVASELARVCRVIDPGRPLARYFEAVERAAIARSQGERKKTLADCVKDFSALLRAKRPERRPQAARLDEDDVAALFEPDGVLGRTHEQYERRQEQIDMARAVCRAFNEPAHLMVEAGTGTGKSLAYAVPAILWSKQADEPVVLSTNTKNLQEQLFFKDLPFLHRSLGCEFRSALIKGRGNYLCVRKLMYALRELERELSPEEMSALLPVLPWFDQTETGDLSECSGFSAGRAASLRPRITSTADECRGRKCAYADACFVRRARALALQADIVVANHSVVFAELGGESQVLPDYKRIVLDEAHNIEDIATEFLARRVSRLRVVRLLGRLYRPTREGAGSGLLPTILLKTRASERLPADAAKALDDALVEAFSRVTETSEESEKFFELFGPVFEKHPNEDKVRFKAGYRDKAVWEPIAQGKRAFVATAARLAHRLKDIQGVIDEQDAGALANAEEFSVELTASVNALREIFEDIEFILRAGDPAYVYWAERRPWGEREIEICAAPIEIGHIMEQRLYEPKDTVVLCSATLTVNDSFEFMMQRLGADGLPPARMHTLAVGSPFDYDRQVLVAALQFLPDPRSPDAAFERALSKFLLRLLRATRGRALVLFTSYNMLNQVYDAVKPALEREGILVLAQGRDGSRSHLARVFRENTASVLLGAQSFWEGVDFVGEALSCLVVVKLPFAVYTDPLIAARCEHIEAQGHSAFLSYSVPSAAIRFRQGFGRLIRTKTDRGVIVVADKRVVTRRYGEQFLRSLPARRRVFADEESLLEEVRSFFDSE